MIQQEFDWRNRDIHGQPVYCDECGYALSRDGSCEVCDDTRRQQDEEDAWWRTLGSSREED